METITNEIMTNEAVAEATEGVVTAVSSNKNFLKKAAEIGVTATICVGIGYLAHKYVVAPIAAKMKAKKEQNEVEPDVDNACSDVDYEDVDNVRDINEGR